MNFPLVDTYENKNGYVKRNRSSLNLGNRERESSNLLNVWRRIHRVWNYERNARVGKAWVDGEETTETEWTFYGSIQVRVYACRREKIKHMSLPFKINKIMITKYPARLTHTYTHSKVT